MLTLDAQVHAYERNHPGRPWVGTLYGPAEVTGDQMVVAMAAVGVDGAVLVSPFSMYRYDASYAKEVYAAHPDRFRLASRSIRPTPQWPIRLPNGPPPKARSASGSS
jgi:L-fuconolactonase